MILSRIATLILGLTLFAGSHACAQGLGVEVTIEGLGKNLERELRPVSSLARKPGSFSALAPIRRAAKSDAQVLLAALQSKGYYAAVIEPDVQREGNVVRVAFVIAPGARFRITGYRIRYDDPAMTDRPADLAAMGIRTDGDPSGSALRAIEGRMLERLWNVGYLGAAITGQQVRANFETATAEAVFTIHSGPQASYGEVLVQGVERTNPDYVRQFRPFEPGGLAQRRQLDTYRNRLVKTSLFSEVEVLPQLPQSDGTTDILVRLSERPHRTLGGGLAFATDVGPSAKVFWENRNFLRRGENLRAEFNVSKPVQEAIASFRKERPRLPGFYTFAAALRNEDTDAFNAQTVEVGSALAKLWFDRRLTTQGGISLQYSDITEQKCLNSQGRELDLGDGETCIALGGAVEGDRGVFQAVSFPLSAVWNSQTQPLDPQEGFIASLSATPFIGTQDFQRIEIAYTDRVFWGSEDGGTLAGRFRMGATYGAGRGDIPATQRFYAGGGGSLRGYAFQEASPIDRRTGDILGGASLAEFNIELRQHVTDTLELAAFTDIGGAFEGNTPSFDQVLVGAGIGIRYHTAIGPIRLDLALPVDRRSFFVEDSGGRDVGGDEDTDPDLVFQDTAFQIYIGLGQPF